MTVHGRLDRAGAIILETVLSDLIEGQGNLDVAVDVAGASVADRVTLNAVRGAAEQARRRGAAFSVRIVPYRAGPSHPRRARDRSAQAFSATSSV